MTQEYEKGGIYPITCRNLRFGVFDGDNGFIGIREKFDSRFLDIEFLPPGLFGTVRHVDEKIGDVPRGIELVTGFSQCAHCGLETNFDKDREPHWQCEGNCERTDPIFALNKPLFDLLNQIEKDNSHKLWVDDIRRPPDNSWDWARTNDEAKEFLSNKSYFFISLDHDMGLHDYDPDAEGADSFRLDDIPEENGESLAKWMVANLQTRLPRPDRIRIHSHNPVGARQMRDILSRWTFAYTDPFDERWRDA